MIYTSIYDMILNTEEYAALLTSIKKYIYCLFIHIFHTFSVNRLNFESFAYPWYCLSSPCSFALGYKRQAYMHCRNCVRRRQCPRSPYVAVRTWTSMGLPSHPHSYPCLPLRHRSVPQSWKRPWHIWIAPTAQWWPRVCQLFLHVQL